MSNAGKAYNTMSFLGLFARIAPTVQHLLFSVSSAMIEPACPRFVLDALVGVLSHPAGVNGKFYKVYHCISNSLTPL